MSFKRKSPGVFVSTVIGTLAGAAIVGGAMVLFTLPALAWPPGPAAQVSGEVERDGPRQPAIRTPSSPLHPGD